MFNCQFFLAAQCNPHIAPFFFNTKGDVGRPNRWMRGTTEHSWRGGFLLAALEIYLKYSMRAKFHFLNDLEAAIGFTSTMMTQTYGGSTTIVPRISFQDYFKVCIVIIRKFFSFRSNLGLKRDHLFFSFSRIRHWMTSIDIFKLEALPHISMYR